MVLCCTGSIALHSETEADNHDAAAIAATLLARLAWLILLQRVPFTELGITRWLYGRSTGVDGIFRPSLSAGLIFVNLFTTDGKRRLHLVRSAAKKQQFSFPAGRRELLDYVLICETWLAGDGTLCSGMF